MMGRLRDMIEARRKRMAADPRMRLLRDAAADAQRSRLPQMAAALAFRTIFGLIPVLVVGLVLVKSFTSPEAQAQVVKDILGHAGMSTIFVDPKAAELPGPPVPDTLAGTLSTGEPTVDAWVNTLMQRAETTVKFEAIGWVGFALLIYAALAMLVEIERAFNQIFRVPRGRSWIKRVVIYWAMLTLGAIGLVATFWVGKEFKSWATTLLHEYGGSVGSSAYTIWAVGFSVTVVISTILLTILYEAVPNTRVRFGPAICGGFLSAILWEAGKWAFSAYLEYSTSYSRLYGSLALLPLFMLWVYYTWLIVLFGLQVTYQLQYGRRNAVPQPITDIGPSLVEPASGLIVMAALARAFQKGKTLSAAEIAQTVGIGQGVVQLVLTAMSERGLAHRIDRPDTHAGEPSYAIAVAPEAIPAERVLEIGFELARSAGGGPRQGAALVDRLHKAQLEAARGQTLASLAGLSSRDAGTAAPPEGASDGQVSSPVARAQPI